MTVGRMQGLAAVGNVLRRMESTNFKMRCQQIFVNMFSMLLVILLGVLLIRPFPHRFGCSKSRFSEFFCLIAGDPGPKRRPKRHRFAFMNCSP
jgi:hypothetical protein